MDFDMTVPCGDCPFRKEGGIKLTKDRIRAIGGMMLDSQGGTFPCHRTVDYARERADDGHRIPGPGEVHCAGALLFAEKQGKTHQMMRIMERLNLYDASKLTDAAKALVWDSLAQWLKSGAIPGRTSKAKK